jgi:DNA modification methylase
MKYFSLFTGIGGFEMKQNIIIKGDCIEEMKKLPENSVDSIVTDPPYGLSFMGKKWDYDVPKVDIWKEAFRVLKPGGHLLSFAGTRTYHRMAVNIEDAGFDIRDMISWLYGSGFPKSLNIGKQIDKIQGNEREDLGRNPAWRKGNGANATTSTGWAKPQRPNKTKGNTEYEGWGTALKPACEPIVVARKPLSEKNVALNVLKWGTGGINIDECRIGTEEIFVNGGRNSIAAGDERTGKALGRYGPNEPLNTTHIGRFPANIILDEEAAKMLDEQSGESGGKFSRQSRKRKWFMLSGSENNIQEANAPDNYGDKGGASRFFYCAKASKSERNLGCEEFEEIKGGSYQFRQDGSLDGKIPIKKNNHPTVKPIKLMEYLIRLVTPKGGIVLDPFLGSGTTALACIKQGMNYIGIEQDEDYCKIAEARIKGMRG